MKAQNGGEPQMAHDLLLSQLRSLAIKVQCYLWSPRGDRDRPLLSLLHGDGDIFHISRDSALKLTPDLRGQLRVGLQPEQFQEGLLLIRG